MGLNGVKGISERNVMEYIVKSRDILDLCDCVPLEGQSLYVCNIQSKLVGSELVHWYTLREKAGFCSKPFYNDLIIGASITGIVSSVEEDLVRVELDGDISQSSYKWFTYSTVYSQPEGTGWYFMPEAGDSIRLHFPTANENEAYVISSTHVTHGDRSDPDTKFIRTKHDKEIRFTPDSILITNNNGSKIEIKDKKGITIETDQGVYISADRDVEVASSGKVMIQGKKGVEIKQLGSLINIEDTIDIVGQYVRVQ